MFNIFAFSTMHSATGHFHSGAQVAPVRGGWDWGGFFREPWQPWTQAPTTHVQLWMFKAYSGVDPVSACPSCPCVPSGRHEADSCGWSRDKVQCCSAWHNSHILWLGMSWRVTQQYDSIFEWHFLRWPTSPSTIEVSNHQGVPDEQIDRHPATTSRICQWALLCLPRGPEEILEGISRASRSSREALELPSGPSRPIWRVLPQHFSTGRWSFGCKAIGYVAEMWLITYFPRSQGQLPCNIVLHSDGLFHMLPSLPWVAIFCVKIATGQTWKL